MSWASRRAVKPAQDRTERLQRGIAVLVTALLHMLLVLLVMPPPPPPMSTSAPQGEADGGRMDVTLIDQPGGSPAPPEPEPPRKPPPPKKPKAPPAVQRAPSTPVVPAAEPTPPAEPQPTEAPPEPAYTNRPQAVGLPPGMRTDDDARASAALAAKLGSNRGRSDGPPPAGPNMELDGFHVYYELVNETRLRAWRDQGMTELFLPLPGTRRLMVCPLEVALHRGSSPCRMVEMDSPELKSIGDAREVINVDRVYHLGEEVWNGPGRYR